MFQYLKMGWEFIGSETITATDPPVPTTTIIPSGFRKILMVIDNTNDNLVFGAVVNEDSPTAVDIQPTQNGVPTLIGPLDPCEFPYHFYCIAPTAIRVTFLGSNMGETEQMAVR